MVTTRSRSGRMVAILAAAGLAMVLAAGAAQAAAGAGETGGAAVAQAPAGRQPAHAGFVAPDQCLHWEQLNADEQRYRTTNNVPFVYTDAQFGVETWFDVACGNLTFAVPVGQEALVDLTAVAELECGRNEPEPTGGWCGGRFLINGLPLPHPDNTGRSDSYAWDSATEGPLDYQAHVLAQEYHAICRDAPGTGGVCFYRVQLQSRLEAGARSVWIDDLTMRVDVSEGPVKVF